tara:strand:+ start:4906 stop:5067 length:162 start_codon:yes stop_codon:yes gene_type:complete
MAVIIAVGVFFGEFLDNFFSYSNPIFTVIFSLFSVFLALYYVLSRLINRHNER